MSQTATKPQPEALNGPPQNDQGVSDLLVDQPVGLRVESLRLLWIHRRTLARAAILGMLLGALIAFLLPKRYESTTQLMPPDNQSGSGIAMMAALTAKTTGSLGSLAGDLLGLKTSGALFIGVLRSQTAQTRLVEQFNLREIYGKRLNSDARAVLDENTAISEDRKSGIISISVTDRNPRRAAALASAYVDQLNLLVTELSTSAAHRERQFLENRLQIVKDDLDQASIQLAQFSSKNNTLDIQQEGKAMLDAAANLAGQLVAGQSQLEGLRQIYTDNNPRVQALSARVAELRRNLGKLGGTTEEFAADSSKQHSDPTFMPYPSIRSLPILGIKYADLYRHTKIQETVYELLTEQYELAKVNEAKETPSVKVLDSALVPQNKSFPPRLSIISVCIFFSFLVAAVVVLFHDKWRRVGEQDPRKVFAHEVAGTLKSYLPEFADANGSGTEGSKRRFGTQRFWRKSPAQTN